MHLHEYHHHLSKLVHMKDKLGLLYFHLILQSFAISLISVFVPIYLLTINFSLPQVFTYLLIEWTLFGLFTPLYGRIIHKLGLREVILIRTPIYIIGLMLLFLLDTNIALRKVFYVVPILMGSSGALYTLSITSLFAKYFGKSNHSMKTAKLISYPALFSIASPTIGALIASVLGFPFLLTFVSIFLFLSVIPIYLIKNNVYHPKFNLKIFREIKMELKEFLFLNTYGLKGLMFFLILPITLFLYSDNIVSLGIIITVISLCSAIFTLILGKVIPKVGSSRLIKVGAICTSVFLLLLGFFLQNELLYYLSIISGFINILINLPYEMHLFEKANDHSSPLEFLAFKEFSLFFGRLLIFGILILFFSHIEIAYFFTAIATLIFLFF